MPPPSGDELPKQDSRRPWYLVPVGAGVLLLASLDSGAPQAPSGNVGDAWSRLAEVYGTAPALVRVPVAWVRDEALQVGALALAETVPLDPEVKARVLARIRSDALVDELVPFLAFLKRVYDQHASGYPTFEDALRAAHPEAPSTWEHALFRWAPPEPESPPLALPSAEVVGQVITLYDAVWLRDAPEGAPVGDTLRCDTVDDERLRRRARSAAPVVRDLVGQLGGALEGEAGSAATRMLADDHTLDTIAVSLIEFVDAEVCKHYRVWAGGVARERALEAWLVAGVETGDPGVFAYLDERRNRRRAVHVIVDGLQGALVRGLATKDASFFAGLSRAVARPSAASTRPGPAISEGWRDRYAAGEFPVDFPTLARVVAGGGVARQGLSTTPTISVRNLPLVMTGAPVAGKGGTGIPNFHFVDRGFVRDGVATGRPWYFYGNDALQLTALTRESGMRTMFERLDRIPTMSCGSQYDEAAGFSFDGFLNLAVGEKLRDFGDALCVAELERRAAAEIEMAGIAAQLLANREVLLVSHRPWEIWDRWRQKGDRAAASELVRQYARLSTSGLPDYLQYYNPWPDHFAHGHGPYGDATIGPSGEYARLDHWLGRVEAAFSIAGARPLFGMAGDHGLTTVRWIVSPEAEVFDALRREGHPLVTRKISSDEGEGPKLTNRFSPPSMKGIDLVIASTAGGNYMIDAFVDQGEGFHRQPVLHELQAWTTLAGDRIDLVDELARRLGDSLDYLAVRVTPCGVEECVTQLWRYRDGNRAVQEVRRLGERIEVSGDDLLGDRIGGASQIAHLYDTDRAGTINLFPVDGVGYNTVVPGRHAGESFAEKDAFVGFWGEGSPTNLEGAVNGQVAPTLYAWLTGETPRAGEDGWGFSAIGG